MADHEQLQVLLDGVEAWNRWREKNPGIRPDLNGLMFTRKAAGRSFAGANLSEADLSGCDFERIDFTCANLRNVDLRKSSFNGCDLSNATLVPIKGSAFLTKCTLYKVDLRGGDFGSFVIESVDATWAQGAGATFSGAKLNKVDFSHAELMTARFDRAHAWQCRFLWTDLTKADLCDVEMSSTTLDLAKLIGAKLTKAKLRDARLNMADLTNADLSGADLSRASLVGAHLDGADLRGCRVYGTSAWDIKGEPKDQTGLIITPENSPSAYVDELDVAHFVYLLNDSKKLRGIIDAMTGRAVLILGRFTSDRMAILQAIALALRKRQEIPIVFNFDHPVDRSTTETIRTLAGLCKMVIADLTDPKSVPYESGVIAPDLAIPFFPIIQEGQSEFAMFSDLYDYDWVLEGFEYRDVTHLISNLDTIRVEAESKREEIRLRRRSRKRGFRKDLSENRASES